MRSCERFGFLSFICQYFFLFLFLLGRFLFFTESTGVGGLIHTYGSISSIRG